jgi:hypothetical protein
MGVDYTAHLVPVILCKAGKIKVETEHDGVCLKCNPPSKNPIGVCPTTNKVKFCGICGATLHDISVIEESEQNTFDITTRLESRLNTLDKESSPDGIHVFYPDNRFQTRSFSIDCKYVTDFQEVNASTLAEEMDWFLKTFDFDITFLKKEYGESNVSISHAFFNEIC